MRTTLWAVLVAATLAPCLGKADCPFAAQRSSATPASGITEVILVSGPGSLVVRGSSGAARIEATGKVCASRQDLLDQVRIKTHREGSKLYVEAITPNPSATSGWAALDLELALPSSLHVDARDSSGDATFQDLKSAKIFDSSGDLKVRRIAGLVDLTDSSGDIDVDEVGSILLHDSSGDIWLERVKNDVEIASDSSGDINIQDVSGNVHVVQDSSGDIEIAHVKGNTTVDADSSGAITVNDIGGDFAVLADSSGGVRYQRVRGKVSLP